jgi:hypothetical protein
MAAPSAEPVATSASAALTPEVASKTVAPKIAPERVRAVVAALRASEGAGTHTERVLRWKKRDKPDEKESPSSSIPSWVRELISWISEIGRGLVWLLGAVAVALLAVFAWRWAQVRADNALARDALRPSHVNDLDIRPESLPDDIARAARTLWTQGQRRPALSLLYRGALSHLVHHKAVDIGAASTEGECLQLAQQTLTAGAGDFFERLVRAWQQAVYAARDLDTATFTALCADFDVYFKPPPPPQHPTPSHLAAGAT